MTYRWIICGLLFLATLINYFDRQILALLKPTLDEQFHWTESQYGYVTAAFQAAYAVGLLGFGWLVDRIGIRISFVIAICAWSLAAMGHSLVMDLEGFFIARIALGLGEGGNFPCSIKAIALWFPPSKRAFATSLFNSGANFGALFAPAIVPLLAVHFGWRSPFIIAGIVGLAWVGLWLPLFREPNADDLEEAVSPVPPTLIPWSELIKNRYMWAFTTGKIITDPIWWFYLAWLPDYFNKTRGLDMQHNWAHLVSIYGIVTVLSITGSWISGQAILRLGVMRGRKLAMLVCACMVLPVYFTSQVSDWVAVILIGIAGAAHQAWSANLYSSVSDTMPKSTVSSIVGFGGMAGSFASTGFPILTGVMLDWFKVHGGINIGYSYLFAFCSIAYIIAFGVIHLLTREPAAAKN